MRIFKTPWFTRFADKEHITGEELKGAVIQLEAGQFDADLGSGVYKQRLARAGQGKSGGYRVLICFRQGVRSFFMYGFPKASRDNISASEKNDLKKLAKILFAMTDEQLDEKVKAGTFQEIKSEA
jgi:hypothetical protein